MRRNPAHDQRDSALAVVPNKATREAKEFCASVVDDPAYQIRVRQRALTGKLPPAVECMLWHYAKGKPKDELDPTFHGKMELVERLQAARRRAAER